jgi:arylsulfatase A-like enzyme
MDTVRQDVFNPDCFPRTWPAIKEDFTRYPNAISGGVTTPHSFPTIITGLPVVGDGKFASDTVTVGEIFDGDTVAFSNNGHLKAERGYDRGFTEFGDNDPPTNGDVSPSPTLIDKIKSIDRINNSSILTKLYRKYQSVKNDPPYSKVTHTTETVTDWTLSELECSPPDFLWAHYMDAHKPFIPEQAIDPPEVKISQEKLGNLNSYDLENNPPAEEYQELLWELYEANVRYLDRGLGELFSTLRSFDWYSEALIILVSDHGELFGEHGHMWHPMTADPVEELIDVPLAVKYPQGERAGEVIERRVQHADIQATVASHMNKDKQVPTPDRTYPLSKLTERITISKSNTSIRVTGPDGYAIRRRDGTEDTFGDPQNKIMKRLRDAEFPDVRTSSGVVRGIEDVDRVEQLKALGYR